MSVHCIHSVKWKAFCASLILLMWGVGPLPAQVPSGARQLIVSIAPEWSSMRASLQCWEREKASSPWRPAFQAPWPVLLGKNGCAWGKGVFVPTNTAIPWKVEKDGKAPAGIFELGRIYGAAKALPKGAAWPYLQVGPYDAWVDNPRLPHYNQHVRVDPANVPPWFESQRMRLGDDAYKWLVEVRHNANPPTAPFGSAIFFHVRRGPDRPSAGCTTMAVDRLEAMISWLRVDKQPYYVLLPRAEYDKVRKAWGLP